MDHDTNGSISCALCPITRTVPVAFWPWRAGMISANGSTLVGIIPQENWLNIVNTLPALQLGPVRHVDLLLPVSCPMAQRTLDAWNSSADTPPLTQVLASPIPSI